MEDRAYNGMKNWHTTAKELYEDNLEELLSPFIAALSLTMIVYKRNALDAFATTMLKDENIDNFDAEMMFSAAVFEIITKKV